MLITIIISMLTIIITMPELTEVTTGGAHPEEEAHDGDSATDSEEDNDSIPELEETSGQKEEVDPVAAAAGISEELVSKAKQSKGEKKARKIMSKLGLKQVGIMWWRRPGTTA